MFSLLKARYFVIYLTMLTPFSYGDAQKGVLELTIIDATTGKPVPARIELRGLDGKSYIADDALPIGGDCGEIRADGTAGPMRYSGTRLDDALAKFTKTRKAPFTEALHFYSAGTSKLKLPPGLFNIKVFKGPEYKLSHTEVSIESANTLQRTIKLSRFANMPVKGWYSADGHLHIARINMEVDPLVLKMMQAEDIHVGNLLQMGRADTSLTTPQYAHGDSSQYREGNHLIISGQENLRTHLLGHTITLGANEMIYKPETYPVYRMAWQQSFDQGALNGYAHFGEVRLGLESGLPVLAPHNLMHFIEVLQFNRGQYGAWYNMLNLGFRITPTAGTDYPCTKGFPGSERFFTKVEGDFTFENWLAGVRAGRTFVTTGPLLEFSVNDQGVGGEVFLLEEGNVTIKGKVLFKKQDIDQLMELELVENGEVIKKFPRIDDSGKINFEIHHKVQETSWFALRINNRYFNRYPGGQPYDTAHTAPVYVTLKNAQPIAKHPRTRAIAKKWLASLDALELRLSQEKIQYLIDADKKFSVGDPIPYQVLMDNHKALVNEIEYAKSFFYKFLSN